MPIKLKGKFYKTVVRPAMFYGSEYWDRCQTQKRGLGNRDEEFEISSRSDSGRLEEVRNKYIIGGLGVRDIVSKLEKRRLKWLAQVVKTEQEHITSVVRAQNLE